MNSNKICFIYCYNDETLLNESIKYVKNLTLPEGFALEILPVEGALSMTQGYNYAMRTSDAKYKVYLHQDVFIFNENFIVDILHQFYENENVGLIGMVGAKTIPGNGIWWDSLERYGKVYDSHKGKMELLSFQEVNSLQTVQAVDGLLIATQYDIPWREDLFTGWHYYDLSQCMEFHKAGYEVGIPSQEEPWCIHDCGIVNVKNGFDEYRNSFLKEYSKDLFPLVSILIPAYNQTVYLKEALESAIHQSYGNIEILIGDDSTNDDVETFVKEFLPKYNFIHYFKNERKSMDYGTSNLEALLKRSKGEYISFLFHDDVMHPKKIERMMKYLLQDDIGLVTSHRQLINEDGVHLPDNGATIKLFDSDTIVEGEALINTCLENLTNYIGEPSTVMFKKDLIKNGFGFYNDHFYVNIGDLATWTTIISESKIVYISDTLSYFRQHSEQNSENHEVKLIGVVEWKSFIDDCFEKGIIRNEREYNRLLLRWFNICCSAFNVISKHEIDNKLKSKLKDSFISVINIISQKNEIHDGIKSTGEIVILDDVFPNLLTNFRVAEYNDYLKKYDTVVYSEDPFFDQHLEEYKENYPELYSKIFKLTDFKYSNDIKLFYTVFLNNIYRYLPLIESAGKPFVFTLYPGGGFWLYNEESDKKLRAVCNSPFLKKIIVTQKITYDYLIDRGFVDPSMVEFIFGVVLPVEYYVENKVEKKYYKKDKSTFDICFVANKYMDKGIDKGFDLFIEVCKKLEPHHPDLRFHVVGGFDENDVSIKGLENKITFYGSRYLDFFPDFYSKMDIILSPNISFRLYPGSFDGFPTGSCVEAGLNGVAVFCTDDLNNNIIFKDNEEICIIDRDEDNIVNKVLYYFENLDQLYKMANNGMVKMLSVFHSNEQMKLRNKLLSTQLINSIK